MPFVYYGEEIGMIGAKPDETIRTPMQWSAEPGGGFTSGTPWESLQSDWMTKNVAAQATAPGSMLNHYRRLIHFRNAHSALNKGALAVASTSNPATAAFLRSSAQETILIAVNFGDRTIDRFAITLGAPAVWGNGAYRLEPLYADPSDGCGRATISGDGKSVALASFSAHGLCAFQLRRN
jgi:glycosidase